MELETDKPADARQQLSRQLEAEKSALRRDAQEALARQTRDLQALFGTALAWSVRSAMLRNNFDEVDQYFGDLVKHPRIPLALKLLLRNFVLQHPRCEERHRRQLSALERRT